MEGAENTANPFGDASPELLRVCCIFAFWIDRNDSIVYAVYIAIRSLVTWGIGPQPCAMTVWVYR